MLSVLFHRKHEQGNASTILKNPREAFQSVCHALITGNKIVYTRQKKVKPSTKLFIISSIPAGDGYINAFIVLLFSLILQ